MDHKTIENYKAITCKDLYCNWVMNAPHRWKKESVRAAFRDVYGFIHTKVTVDEPMSSLELDTELMEILEAHRKEGSMAKFQAIFVALLLETIVSKDGDLYGKKRHPLLTHGYKCNLLSFFLAQLLGDHTIELILQLYRSPVERNDVLSFFA